MPAPRTDDLLDRILSLARQYALQRFGAVPTYLKITLPDGREQVMLMPALARADDEATAEAYTPKQALVIEALRDADGEDVSEVELLKAADSDASRLRDLFRHSPAWGRVVVKGGQPKTYRLGEDAE